MSPSFTWDFRGRKSLRLEEYDYSSEGCYFLTICTAGKEKLFGEIVEEKMALSRYGYVAQRYWKFIPGHFPNTALDSFIIMPNHIHGLIWIKTPDSTLDDKPRAPCRGEALPRPDGAPPRPDGVPPGSLRGDAVRYRGDAVRRPYKGSGSDLVRPRGPVAGSVGAIIGSYKSIVSKQIHRMGYGGPVWQHNYWDRIAMDDEAIWNIREYIRDNPQNWERDPENI